MRIRNAGRPWRYVAAISGLNSAKDLITFTPAAHVSLAVIAYTISNVSNGSSCQVETAISKVTGGTPGGSSTTLTAISLDGGGGSPSGVAEKAVTGNTYDGTTDEDLQGWPSVAGYQFRPPAEGDWLWLPAGSANLYALRTINAPSAAFDVAIVIDVIEVAG